MSKEYWNEEYWKKHLKEHAGEKLEFLENLWIDEYESILDEIPKDKALDLGCGLGQYTKKLIDKGFDVISADISIEALNNLKENLPNAKIVQLDMSEPFDFEDNTFDLVFANLSIHYFDTQITERILQEIRRIVKKGGYFIGSVNSSKVYRFIQDYAVEIEKNYYLDETRCVRLWDKEQFDYFFKDFEQLLLKEVSIIRWNKPKDIWEFIYKINK